MSGEIQVLIAIDRFSKWPTTTKKERTRKINNVLTTTSIYTETLKSDECGGHQFQENKESFKNLNLETENCPLRMHTGNGTVEIAIHSMKYIITANLEDGNYITDH